MIDISVIIPALNEENNLIFLLDEILTISDTEKWNYEIIVVNDNSSDSAGDILDFYAKRYSNTNAINVLRWIRQIITLSPIYFFACGASRAFG